MCQIYFCSTYLHIFSIKCVDIQRNFHQIFLIVIIRITGVHRIHRQHYKLQDTYITQSAGQAIRYLALIWTLNDGRVYFIRRAASGDWVGQNNILFRTELLLSFTFWLRFVNWYLVTFNTCEIRYLLVNWNIFSVWNFVSAFRWADYAKKHWSRLKRSG